MRYGRLSRAGLLGLVVVSTLSLGGQAQTPQAPVVATGFYYPTASWMLTVPGASRFIVLSNLASAAVLDIETGLVWEKSPSTASQTLSQANFHCLGLGVGGRMGWRLPTAHELTSLLDPSLAGIGPPALPVGNPFTQVSGGAYWALDRDMPPFANESNQIIVFLDDGVINTTNASSTARDWCVRGPGGSPSPW
jgi:hypothetical protein